MALNASPNRVVYGTIKRSAEASENMPSAIGIEAVYDIKWEKKGNSRGNISQMTHQHRFKKHFHPFFYSFFPEKCFKDHSDDQQYIARK